MVNIESQLVDLTIELKNYRENNESRLESFENEIENIHNQLNTVNIDNVEDLIELSRKVDYLYDVLHSIKSILLTIVNDQNSDELKRRYWQIFGAVK